MGRTRDSSVFASGPFAPSAADYIVNGALTASDSTYNRLSTATALSSVGTAVHYDTYAFQVSQTGTYAAEMFSGTGGFDTYLYVYSSFNPAAPTTGLLNGDDDYAGSLPILGATSTSFIGSRIVSGDATNYLAGGLLLTAGTTYTAVATSFNNTDLGTYSVGIGGGPGNVFAPQATPEPSAFAALGLGAVAFVKRRKKA